MTGIQKYLDQSLAVLERFGFLDRAKEESQLAQLLNDVVSVDEASVISIAKTVIAHQLSLSVCYRNK